MKFFKLVLPLLVAISLLLSGCNSGDNIKTESVPTSNNATIISGTPLPSPIVGTSMTELQFLAFQITDPNPSGIIQNKVVLNVLGKDYYLGNFDAIFEDGSRSTWEFEKNSILKLFGWWGGAGYLLSVAKTDNQLNVYSRSIWEGSEKYGERKLLRTIPIPYGITLTTKPAVLLNCYQIADAKKSLQKLNTMNMIEIKNDFEDSTEGTELKIFKQGEVIKVIRAVIYGEMGKTELNFCYIEDNVFCIEKQYSYDVPIYQDSNAKQKLQAENDYIIVDQKAYQFNKPKIVLATDITNLYLKYVEAVSVN